jgi:hypothetical protein
MFHEAPLCFLMAGDGLGLSLNFWLVIAGILIIFLCFLSLFFPGTQTLREKTQEFSGLGVSMKVSIITVFVLMGFILSLSSFAIQWKGYVEQAEEFDENTRRLNERIALLMAQVEQQHEQAKKMRVIDVGILLRPKFETGDGSQILKADEWRCEYIIANAPGQPPSPLLRTSVMRGPSGNTLRVFIKNITPETKFEEIKIVNTNNNKVWSTGGFSPFNDGTIDLEEGS